MGRILHVKPANYGVTPTIVGEYSDAVVCAKNILDRINASGYDAVAFGSILEPTAWHITSDIDIAILSDISLEKFGKLLDSIGEIVCPYSLDVAIFDRVKDNIKTEILRYGKKQKDF